MRTSIPTLAVAASSILGADALQLAQPRDAAPRVVQHDIQRRHVDNPLARDRYRMRKRDNTVSVGLENEETLYFMNVSIGTPAQDLKLHIDTGSSDLWVNVPNSQLCSGQGDPCADSGTYDANSSSTYSYINSQFNITYVDGSGSFGDYASDVVSFGGVTLRDQQFGIGYSSSSQEGILGIGYPINEVAVAYNGGRTYANVPQHLMQTGQINSNAYSLWLNDLDASMGSILFGGVNTDKFNGQLQTVPIIPEQGVYAEFIIALTGVGVNGSEGSLVSNLASPALLDSGSSLMYLPDNVAQDVFNAVGAQYDERQGAAFVDCDLANSDMTIDFTFSSPTIRVGMDELVIVAGVDRGQPICILGIAPAGGSTPVLGDTFLRSAYVVYDITSNEISLAQTNFNSTSTDNVLEIHNGTNPVPSATVVQNAVTSVAVQSGGHINGGEPTGISGSSANSGTPTASAGYTAALIGAIGVAVLAL